jgi:hypothetical protein
MKPLFKLFAVVLIVSMTTACSTVIEPPATKGVKMGIISSYEQTAGEISVTLTAPPLVSGLSEKFTFTIPAANAAADRFLSSVYRTQAPIEVYYTKYNGKYFWHKTGTKMTDMYVLNFKPQEGN